MGQGMFRKSCRSSVLAGDSRKRGRRRSSPLAWLTILPHGGSRTPPNHGLVDFQSGVNSRMKRLLKAYRSKGGAFLPHATMDRNLRVS